MTVSLRAEDMEQTLENAYLLANSDAVLPAQWIARAEQLGKSPSVAFIAAVGSVLLDVLEGFVSADPEGGARGMALVAAAFRAAGLEARLPSRHDPRRIDVPIKRARVLVLASEVKQEETSEAVADTLARDAASHG